MAKLIIEAGQSDRHYWRDLWHFRELFYVLAWRDLAVRYKQTVVGVLWAVIQPLLTSIIFALIFGRLAKLDHGGPPYFLVVFAAMMPWQFFSNSLAAASQSVVGNAQLISKVYFPRLIVPAAAVVVSLADLAVSFGLLLVFMVWYEYAPTWRLLFLPLFAVVCFFAALGPGLILTALTVRYRDFRFVVPFLVQIGFFVSPVGYATPTIPERWRFVYSLNPMVGVIDGFRWCVLAQDDAIYLPGLLSSLAVTALVGWTGIRYFRETERTFADVI